MSAFAFLSTLLFGETNAAPDNLLALAWIATGTLGIATALFALIPASIAWDLLRNTGSAWVFAAAAAVATPLLISASDRLWKSTTLLTFELVRFVLRPFVVTVADPVTGSLGTHRFSVEIAPACSGLEGMGLMLIFGVVCLAFFYRDYRFPRALLLVPIGMGLMFLLNSLRIAALILIGHAGAESVALGGFHSQAGWIAFNGLALVWMSVGRRLPWMCRQSAVAQQEEFDNPSAAYLMPFLAIVAASMTSRAASGAFEWMYPLRFIAGGAMLFAYRKQYSKLKWECGWLAAVVGGLVFVLWIAMDRLAGNPSPSGIASGLAALPAPARTGWLVFRTLAAVVTVPIAEELAFRGYLLRRFISADFESVSMQRWTALAVVGSSIAFGLLHGQRWMAGVIAGLLYAAVQRWRGRIGDAVAAHAITNALLSAWVISQAQWSLW
jgi:exosortase E/protease (VPEID-CTERM system)